MISEAVHIFKSVWRCKSMNHKVVRESPKHTIVPSNKEIDVYRMISLLTYSESFFECLNWYHVDSSDDLSYNRRFIYDGSPNVVSTTMSVC